MKCLRRWARGFWQNTPCRWITTVALAAIIGLVIGRRFLESVCYVSGNSMAPTFKPGACLFTASISSPLERGDVVVLDDGFAGYAIKRIIGLPGETVQLWRGQVFIDRQAITEPYVPKNVYTYAKQRAICVLGAAEYYVMGDNRLKSVDSRVYGPVRRSKIKRRIPLPANSLRAQFTPYLLPAPGCVLPRPIVSKGTKLPIF